MAVFTPPVATARKPSTGLKHVLVDAEPQSEEVATARKPSTGLKQLGL